MSDLTARLRLDGESRAWVDSTTRAKAGLEGLGAAGRSASGGLNAAGASAERLDRSTRGAGDAARLLGSALAYLGVREIVRDITAAAQATQGWATGLGAVAGGAGGAAAEMAFLRAESARLGLVVRDQTNSFMSLAGATNGTSLAGQQTREIWLSLVEAGTALNRSSEQQKRGLEAISQIASKGTVSLEELRGQLAEAIPGAVQIAARAMNMTTGELMDLVAQGELASDVFLPRFAAQLRQEFGPAIEAAMNIPLGRARREIAETQNALFDLEAAAGQGFLSGVTEGLAGLNRELTDPEARAAVQELGRDLGELVGAGAKAMGVLVDNLELVTDGAKVLTTVGLAGWFTNTALAGGAVRTVLGSLSAFMGGPLGITLAAVGVGVWSVVDAFDEAKRSTEAVQEATAESNQVISDAETFLRNAADAARDYGSANAGAVKGTDDLAAATFRLANAEAERNRQRIEAQIIRNNERIEQIENPGLLAQVGEFILSAGSGGDTYDPGTSPSGAEILAGDRKRKADAIRDENARLMALSVRLAVAPLPADPPSSGGGGGSTRDRDSEAEKAAKRRIEQADEMAAALKAETAALADRAAAAGKSEQALEDLRVNEARLQALMQLGVTSLDQLTGKQREAAQAAVEAAEARERQAIATEKAERVADTLRDLDAQIASERAYAEALKGGERALVDLAVAEEVRREVERTGKTLTREQIAEIERKTRALFELKAANDGLDERKALEEELRLARMTTEERELEVRVLALKRQYLRENLALTEAEAEKRARITAKLEQELRLRAREAGQLKDDIRRAFIDGGELGLDDLGEYAERRLRQAVYDALLKKPIDIIVDATVNVIAKGLDELLKKIMAAANGGDGTAFEKAAKAITGGIEKLYEMLPAQLQKVLGQGMQAYAYAQVGGQMADMVGLKGSAKDPTGQKIMDTAAAAIGNALGGPIGATIATFISRAIGPALFGKPSNNGANAVFDSSGGYTIGGSKRTRQTEDAARGVAESITGLVDSLKGVGIDASGIISKVQLGTRDPSKITLADGSTIKTRKGDMEALVEAAGRAMLAQAQYEDPQMKALVDQMIAANRSFEQIVDKLDRYVAAQDFREDIGLALLRFTDERAYTIAALERDQKARRDAAEAFGKEGLYTDAQLAEIRANLDALEDAELAEALERLGDAATDAERALADARDGFRQWIDRMTQSSAAPLNPFEQRQLAMAQYERQLEKARAGDADALGSLTGYADRLLSADIAATSSAQQRLALWNKVMGDIEALAAPSTVTTQDAIAALTASNSQVTLQAAQTVVASIAEPGGVVAVLEDQTTKLSQKLDGLAATIAAAVAQLHQTTGAGLGELTDTMAATQAAIGEMAAEQRTSNALAKIAAARA